MDDFAIYVMSDSKEYRKNITIQLQKLGKTVVSDLQSDDDFYAEIGKDYAATYYSKGIISICLLRYSAFPYSIAAQRGIPLLYEPQPPGPAWVVASSGWEGKCPDRKECFSNNYPCSLEAKSFDDFISKMK